MTILQCEPLIIPWFSLQKVKKRMKSSFESLQRTGIMEGPREVFRETEGSVMK